MILLRRNTILSTKLSDDDLACALADGAGKVLLALQKRAARSGSGTLGAEGDSRSQEYLKKALHQARPDDLVLSEEAADNPGRLNAERVWIIDPLDGTREYAEGRGDWAIHVALWSAGELVTGAVALPRLDMICSSARPGAVAAPHTTLRMAVSRSRAPALAALVAEEIGAELVPMGSAGYKVCAVASGEVDIYLHDGGQYEWDSAAPVAVARGAGLHASRIDGSALRYNQANPYLPDLLVCRRELSEPLLRIIKDATLASSGSERKSR
ncbi:3'(2'),5'-bisphosphate nucleotidase CysQ [Arthrobacter sp. H14-L1]|uniref:3'(2'),5'-bisphosphate nucleotidase CysQ n=1 Tax=Arthrobacter sp. H14-L1 TaxID=2996697 RepID=UPI00227197C4|nr:3'(2'),5'-bisphosphate nucleotidase CysQ [Arthrobacter sp. H14-L1]MCY0905714.1 3'(2'),5'-bisphosphate nucleotidase CysQ [Arthrobacter sp. H14-L1]